VRGVGDTIYRYGFGVWLDTVRGVLIHTNPVAEGWIDTLVRGVARCSEGYAHPCESSGEGVAKGVCSP
jgi:hypothetical protein